MTIIGHGNCATTKTNALEKTLFIPAITYPALVHLHSSGYSSDLLDNAAAYPRYIYNHNFNDYAETLQKQPLYQVNNYNSVSHLPSKNNSKIAHQSVISTFIQQDMGKRLENILHVGEDRKTTKNIDTDDENYGKVSNNILYQEDTKPELEELDRRYRRSHIYVPPLRATSNQKLPFGPYTTWLPYEGPISRASQNNQYARVENDQYPRNTQFDESENLRA